MADGQVFIEVNTEGAMRVMTSETLGGVHFFDIRLTCLDIDDEFIRDEMEGQLPEGLKDVLIMCLFKYKSVSSGGYWDIEYEDSFELEHFAVAITDYKEFYRLQVTEELSCKDFGPGPDDRYYDDLVADWEEFYDEDFKPFEKPKQVYIERRGLLDENV
ncbi:hypothetical protein P59_200 [Bacillus phage P59]|nr:hypothetical protein P59_200 [Bacillus phage P59]